jgi:hypothetical protein
MARGDSHGTLEVRTGPLLQPTSHPWPPGRDDPGTAIGVLQARDNHGPIGMAPPIGWDVAGAAVWRLTAHGAGVPGRWIVVDRESRPAD